MKAYMTLSVSRAKTWAGIGLCLLLCAGMNRPAAAWWSLIYPETAIEAGVCSEEEWLGTGERPPVKWKLGELLHNLYLQVFPKQDNM